MSIVIFCKSDLGPTCGHSFMSFLIGRIYIPTEILFVDLAVGERRHISGPDWLAFLDGIGQSSLKTVR